MSPVDLGAKAFWLVVFAGVLSGIASLWAFRRWSDTAKIRLAVKHIIAHLFELRLFADEPLLVLRAQRDLLTANAHLLRQVTGASLLLLFPFAVLLIAMDAVFGHAPLHPGSPAVVTLDYSRGANLPQAYLKAPAGIEVETAPIRIPALSQISWRIRPLRAAKGQLQISSTDHIIQKSISSAPNLQWLSDTRAGSVQAFFVHPLELPFSATGVNSISVGYPRATVLGLNWLIWFSLASVVGALAWAFILSRR